MTADLQPIDADARQALLDLVLNAVNSPHTRRAYARALTDFLAWHATRGRPALSKNVVQAYKTDLQTRGKSAAVINQHLSAIRKLVREAADNAALDPVLAAGITRIAGIAHHSLPAGRAINRGELLALLNTCAADMTPAGARDAALIALLYAGGLRRAEVVALSLADFDVAGKSLKVHGKGNKERTVPLAGGTFDAMLDWLAVRGEYPGALFVRIRRGGHINRTRLTTQAVYHILQHRAAQAGVQHLSPHDFRRTFVGDLLDAGADIATVQQLAGHADVSTTARYDRRGEKAKQKAVALLHVPYRRRKG